MRLGVDAPTPLPDTSGLPDHGCFVANTPMKNMFISRQNRVDPQITRGEAVRQSVGGWGRAMGGSNSLTDCTAIFKLSKFRTTPNTVANCCRVERTVLYGFDSMPACRWL